MFYFATPKQQSKSFSIFEKAKSLKAIHSTLKRKSEVWPDHYSEGMAITVCKKDKAGQMYHFADYYFESDKMRKMTLAESMLEDL